MPRACGAVAGDERCPFLAAFALRLATALAQMPSRLDRMPSSLNRRAMAFIERPPASNSLTIGSKPRAKERAASDAAPLPLPGFRFDPPLGLPSLTPRAFAAARAALVRALMASRSAWATTARMPG